MRSALMYYMLIVCVIAINQLEPPATVVLTMEPPLQFFSSLKFPGVVKRIKLIPSQAL